MDCFSFFFGLKAIEEFAAAQKTKAGKLAKLAKKAEKGGVLGRAAAQEIRIIESADTTETNRIELTLKAAKRKGAKKSGEVALEEQKAREAKTKATAAAASKAKLKARMAMFEKH